VLAVAADDTTTDSAKCQRLLEMLDGLPLAIAQAGAYLQESGTPIEKYIQLYEQQWRELMESHDQDSVALRDYQQRSVLTTWTISYNAIRGKNLEAANLLLLWACLDNKDMWYDLLAEARKRSRHVKDWISKWLPNIADNEPKFIAAITLLRNYSLVEHVQGQASYTTHPVVHTWAYHLQNEQERTEFTCLAVAVVGWAVPRQSEKEYASVQRRLLPHAQQCSRWVLAASRIGKDWTRISGAGSLGNSVISGAIHGLGQLYANQGKLIEAEQMYDRALQGKEEALGHNHTSTLRTVGNLGILYKNQGKLAEAEQMYERALRGKEEALGPNHTSTLRTVGNLGLLYKNQGKLAEAQQMYERALQGKEEARGLNHTSTLKSVNNRGNLYRNQGRLAEAEQMYERALRGHEETLGPNHTSTLNVVNNHGLLYADQGKLTEAEQMYDRALRGYEEALGPNHTSTLRTVGNLGILYKNQGKLAEAEQMYERALRGKEEALGPNHTSTLRIVGNLGLLYKNQGKLAEAQQMYERALRGKEEALGPNHPSTLRTVNKLRNLYADQDRVAEAEQMYKRALPEKAEMESFHSAGVNEFSPTLLGNQALSIRTRLSTHQHHLIVSNPARVLTASRSSSSSQDSID
jgi:tetratricopeptide (TPR) repeat protein